MTSQLSEVDVIKIDGLLNKTCLEPIPQGVLAEWHGGAKVFRYALSGEVCSCRVKGIGQQVHCLPTVSLATKSTFLHTIHTHSTDAGTPSVFQGN